MTRKTVYRSLLVALLLVVFCLSACGRADAGSAAVQPADGASSEKITQAADSKRAQPAKSVTHAHSGGPRIVATSMATVYILERLDVDVIGVPASKVDPLPKRYKNAEIIGSPMNPDQEKLAALRPDWVFSPVSLLSDLLPTYQRLGLNYGFVNLNNVDGMYRSIQDMGEILDRREEATRLVKEYETFMTAYRARHQGKKPKKVLVLMGLPGSYVVATNQSYVGSLVEMAGAKNVYTSDKKPFLNVNVEDMLQKDPDIILRTAHAMPDDVMAMFAKDFKENPNWKHFRAVKENKVYDLNHDRFGMSAKFNYPEALDDLEVILYDTP